MPTIPPNLPVQPAPTLQPQRKLRSVQGLLKWIIGLAWVMLVLSTISLVPNAVYTMEVLHPSGNEVAMALAYPCNDYVIALSNEEGITHGKDWRGTRQKEYDEEAYLRIVSGDPEFWYGDF